MRITFLGAIVATRLLFRFLPAIITARLFARFLGTIIAARLLLWSIVMRRALASAIITTSLPHVSRFYFVSRAIIATRLPMRPLL
jgi:hypothetical protein